MVVRIAFTTPRHQTSPHARHSFLRGFVTKEVAFFHKDSKSLIEADLLFNLPPNEQVPSFFPMQTITPLLTAGTVFQIQESNLLSPHEGHESVVLCTQAIGMVGRQRQGVRNHIVPFVTLYPSPPTFQSYEEGRQDSRRMGLRANHPLSWCQCDRCFVPRSLGLTA